MEVENNPAGRLHDLLRAAQKHPPTQQVREVWAAVFDIDPNDTEVLLQMLAELIRLTSDTKTAIERLDDVDHDIYLKPFRKLEKFLTQINLNAKWEQWRSQLDEPTLYGLQFAADRLSRESGTSSIAQEDLESIRSELEDFLSSILQSDLPQGMKALFVRNLESIRHALLVYQIKGVDGLQHELERAVGSLVLNRNNIPPAGTESEVRSFWERLFLLVDRINKAVTLSRTSNEIAGPAVEAISHILDK